MGRLLPREQFFPSHFKARTSYFLYEMMMTIMYVFHFNKTLMVSFIMLAHCYSCPHVDTSHHKRLGEG